MVFFFFSAAIILFLFFTQRQKTKQQDAQEQAESASQPAVSQSAPASQPAKASTAAATRPRTAGAKLFTDAIEAEELFRIGSPDPRSGYMFQLELSNRAAGVFTAKLSNYFATVADKKRHGQDPNTYEAAHHRNPERYKGHYSLLNPVGFKGRRTPLPMATEAITLEIDGETKPIRTKLDSLCWRLAKRTSTAESENLSFSVTIYRGSDLAEARKNPLVRVVKSYTVTKDDYSIAMSLRLENLSGRTLKVTIDQAGPTGLPREDLRRDMRQAAYAYQQAADQQIQHQLKPAAKLRELRLGKKHELKMRKGTPMLWIGQISKFFGSIMYLHPAVEGRLAATSYDPKFYVRAAMESPDSRTYLTGVSIPNMVLHAGGAKELAFDIFAGPKKRELFSNEKAKHFKKLYGELKYIKLIDLEVCFLTFGGMLPLAMMWLLEVFSVVSLGNYGVAIIILVLLVRLVLHPLTKKSQISMMRMQKLTPQMQKLKEKYADDKSTLNKEMMKLYKEQGASPLLGCLPMLLQMPILIALYTGINAAVELRHAAFLPVWITDLAAPDALISWSNPVPFIGTSFNLLPILLAIAMFFQQKFSPQSAQAAMSDQAQQQQKMMKYMFPLMMPVIFYNAASGLTLYFMTSMFAGVLDQYVVRKHIRDKEAAEAAEQTTVRVPGKAARSRRTKKPKGPFWVKHG